MSNKVFFLIDDYRGPNAGTERQIWLLIKGLLSEGIESRLFVLRHTEFTQRTQDFPCEIESLKINSIASRHALTRMRAFRKRIQRDNADVVHAFFNDSAILAPTFCRTPRTKVFTSRRDMGFWYSPMNLIALRFANALATGIICNSEAVANSVRRREQVPVEKLHVVPNACEITHYLKCSEGQPRAWDGNAIIRVCLVANLQRIKRIEEAIQGVSLARTHHPSMHLWIIGDTPVPSYYRELRQLVKHLDAEHWVTFFPKTTDPISYMRNCDIGILTSASEGLSNTIMEYMGSGIPVVCSDVGGNYELIEHGSEGFRYPLGNTEQLAEHLVTLARDPALVARLGKNGRSKVRQFTVETLVSRHCSLYFPARDRERLGTM